MSLWRHAYISRDAKPNGLPIITRGDEHSYNMEKVLAGAFLSNTTLGRVLRVYNIEYNKK